MLLDAFTTGAFATPSYVGKRDKLLARDFSPDFALGLALKDGIFAEKLVHVASTMTRERAIAMAAVAAATPEDAPVHVYARIAQ